MCRSCLAQLQEPQPGWPPNNSLARLSQYNHSSSHVYQHVVCQVIERPIFQVLQEQDIDVPIASPYAARLPAVSALEASAKETITKLCHGCPGCCRTLHMPVTALSCRGPCASTAALGSRRRNARLALWPSPQAATICRARQAIKKLNSGPSTLQRKWCDTSCPLTSSSIGSTRYLMGLKFADSVSSAGMRRW